MYVHVSALNPPTREARARVTKSRSTAHMARRRELLLVGFRITMLTGKYCGDSVGSCLIVVMIRPRRIPPSLLVKIRV